MKILVCVLIFLVVILLSYILFIKSQISTINKQLIKRLKENTRQPISLNLFDKDLNELGSNINKCFKAEENLRHKAISEENMFKEMIANISHDLRTPLTAIKGYQQLIGKGMLDENQRQKLQIATKHTEDLGNLINNFFEYSYYVNMEQKINLEKINLTNIVTECLIDSITSFEEKNIAVEFEETQQIFIIADKDLLKRIIQNLIGNCIKHSAGDIKVRILLEDDVIISFKNPIKEGSNIDVNKIFNRFYTGDEVRSNSTGLGLSIVKILAEKMGGSAQAQLIENILDIRVILSY